MDLLHGELTGKIIGCAMRVHSFFGPGLSELVYEMAMCHELRQAGLSFRRQQPVAVNYRGTRLGVDLSLDLIVEDTVIIELKATPRILPLHEQQLVSYLLCTQKEVGLLINFNVIHLRNGLRRKVNTVAERERLAADGEPMYENAAGQEEFQTLVARYE